MSLGIILEVNSRQLKTRGLTTTLEVLLEGGTIDYLSVRSDVLIDMALDANDSVFGLRFPWCFLNKMILNVDGDDGETMTAVAKTLADKKVFGWGIPYRIAKIPGVVEAAGGCKTYVRYEEIDPEIRKLSRRTVACDGAMELFVENKITGVIIPTNFSFGNGVAEKWKESGLEVLVYLPDQPDKPLADNLSSVMKTLQDHGGRGGVVVRGDFMGNDLIRSFCGVRVAADALYRALSREGEANRV